VDSLGIIKNNMANRILIIGSQGNLGQALVRIFEADQNWEVFAYDRPEIDIVSEENLRRHIEEVKPDAVVNATGYNAVDKCETDEIEYELAIGKPGTSPVSKKSFFDTMIAMAKDNHTLKLIDEEKSCFTYTPDLALETKKMIEEKIPLGIYHVVNEGACTWYEAALELFKLAKMDVEVIPVNSSEFPRPAKRPRSSVLLNTKLKPLRDYREALKEYLEESNVVIPSEVEGSN